MGDRALEGIRILDMSRYAAGPMGTQILADMGAEVWKVEAPGVGDVARTDGTQKGGIAAYFCAYNRNKTSITANPKDPEAKEMILELAKKADVFVHNMGPGTMERLGLSYEDIKKINPSIIYTAISGFGATDGPYKNKACMDPIAQAMGGLMSVNGFPDRPPLKVGPSIADIITAYYATIGMLAALYERKVSGKGQFIDIALVDCVFASLDSFIPVYNMTGKVVRANGNRMTMIGATGVYMAKDKPFMMTNASDGLAFKTARAMGREDMIEDPRYQSNTTRCIPENQDWIDEQINAWAGQLTRMEVLDILSQAGVPCGPINDIEDCFNDPHFKLREMIVSLPHPTAGELTMAGNPIKFSRTPVVMEKAPPLLGDGNEAIYKEILDKTDEQLAAMKERGAI